METTTEHTRDQTSQLIKVVLFGPESTGKTTLAEQLANHYQTEWVPEFMRRYLEKKWEEKKEIIVREDLIPIAKGQLEFENEQAKKANKILFCDTNLLELKVYSEYYYDGYCPEFIRNEATKNKYHIYLLTYIDIPWTSDFLRDRPNNREEMFQLFENELKIQKFPYVIIKGSGEERFNRAKNAIDELLQNYYCK